GIRQIKTYTLEEAEHRRFNDASQNVRNASLVVMRAWAFYNPGMTFLAAIGLIIVLAFGGQAAIDGNLEAGELAAFVLLLQLFYDPINRLHSLNQLFQAGRAAGERVFEILDSNEELNTTDGDPLPPVRGEIVYDNV